MRQDHPYMTIVLLLISKGTPLNSSYKLMQFIELKLKTIESNKILEKIEKDSYVEFDIINGVHYYTLTSIGNDFISKEFDNAKSYLLQKYYDEDVLITEVFNSYKKA